MHLTEAGSGITFFSSYNTFDEIIKEMEGHCTLKKYAQNSDSWFGVTIDPNTKAVITALHLNDKWVFDSKMEELVDQFKFHRKV